MVLALKTLCDLTQAAPDIPRRLAYRSANEVGAGGTEGAASGETALGVGVFLTGEFFTGTYVFQTAILEFAIIH